MALHDAFMLFERGKSDATANYTTIRSMHSHSHMSSTLLPLLAAKKTLEWDLIGLMLYFLET